MQHSMIHQGKMAIGTLDDWSYITSALALQSLSDFIWGNSCVWKDFSFGIVPSDKQTECDEYNLTSLYFHCNRYFTMRMINVNVGTCPVHLFIGLDQDRDLIDIPIDQSQSVDELAFNIFNSLVELFCKHQLDYDTDCDIVCWYEN